MDRFEIARNLRQLIELDRGFGVEFMPRSAQAAGGVVAPAPARAETVARAVVPAVGRSAASALQAPTVQAAPVRVASPSSTAAMAAPVARLIAPAAPPAGDSIAVIAAEVAACRACGLCSTRMNTVPGEGALRPELLFIGEGPGADEDTQGRPFVGVAGQLLDRMIGAMGLARAEVFIANVVKCRPPANRNPLPEEIAACLPFLHRQIAALAPKVICTLGNVPLRALFGAEQPGITSSRGKRLSWHGTVVIPTFHPSYLLRNEQAKKPAWEDLLTVLKELGREPPKRR